MSDLAPHPDLAGPVAQKIINNALARFHNTMIRECWKVNPCDPHSEQITTELQNIMLQEMVEIIDSLARAKDYENNRPSNMNANSNPSFASTRTDTMEDVFAIAGAKIVESKIQDSEQMRNYTGNQIEAAHYLLGSVIKRALEISAMLNIKRDISRGYFH